MKPRIFIGSSVEGLSVAYAIQQNLTYDAESTVWDQGIFELSQTTIESLSDVVDNSDFGIFVFTPDDITTIRGKENNTIRDNVIFEFGLFIGHLGRDRVFFITPDGSDFRLPTDLLGVTPGKYDPSRKDGSLQAACGPACNQIRQTIKKLPLLTSQDKENEADEAEEDRKSKNSDWIFDLVDNKFSSARDKIKEEIKEKTGADLLEANAWLAYVNFKEDEVSGLDPLLEIAKENEGEPKILALVARMFLWETYTTYSLEIINNSLEKYPENNEFMIIKSECLKTDGDIDSAIEALRKYGFSDVPEVAISLSELHEEKGDLEGAIESISFSYLKYPNNKSVLYKYSRLLQNKGRNKEALYLLNKLVAEYPDEVAYWGYLSNTCLQLDLYEKAMSSCKKALDLSQGKEAWILHNIGNMFKNKGFYSEAEEWLNKGLEVEPKSEYAHDRLSGAIKSRNEEQRKFLDFCNEGRIALRRKYQEKSDSLTSE
ncbi:TIR domain-containing protein [Marinobacter nauticus]|uniref:TIR domain-containing protein n=1 Tax=Marinobacter nauticus TaxID=2743 RepID=UPI001CD74296|nr:TIR domain-containing protein [Marinobacter nauticus]MCA0914608.1 nucleotide-binding protein [Marinobacter nauticus]